MQETTRGAQQQAPLTRAAVARQNAAQSARARRRKLALELTVICIAGLAVIAGSVAASAAVYQKFYSPTAFVVRYLDLLSDSRAADALQVPGVAIDSEDLPSGINAKDASEALLRAAALGPLTAITPVTEVVDGDVTRVTVGYKSGGYEGATTFTVQRDGTIGVAPAWRFAVSPLAVLELQVQGSFTFEVNGFSLDKRQVSPNGVDADPEAPVELLVFSPGLYAVSVDTAIAETPGVAVVSDSPLMTVPVSVQATPTKRFTETVQDEVDKFLADCATQQVLQPTGCPFGFTFDDRISEPPTWSILTSPTVSLTSSGADWLISDAPALARIDLMARSLFDGHTYPLSQDIPFLVNGSVTITPDGTASINVGGYTLEQQ